MYRYDSVGIYPFLNNTQFPDINTGNLGYLHVILRSNLIIHAYNLHYEKFADGSVKCIEDEIPFEVPEGWVWCRLESIAYEIFAGGDKPDDTVKEYDSLHTIPIYSNGIELDGLYGYTSIPRVVLPSITISARGTIGFTRVRRKPFLPIIRLITIVPYKEIDIEYLSMVFQALMVPSEGSSIPQLTVPVIKPKLIPVPPIKEQQKLHQLCKNFDKLILYIGKEKRELQILIKQTKSKLLDLAIRGKLVPQDSDDEPASVLLERIRIEKEELIKQGQLKRDKKESIIFRGDDNSYYEKIDNHVYKIDNECQPALPNGWEYARLKSICTKIVDGSHNPPKGQNHKTEYLMMSSRNINDNTFVDLDNVRYLSKTEFEKENERTLIASNDILLTTVGSLGRSCIYQKNPLNLCFQRSVTVISTLILPQYLKLYFDSPCFQRFMNDNANGTAQKGFYLNQLENVIIPIPPISEQHTLVSCAEELMRRLNQIYLEARL